MSDSTPTRPFSRYLPVLVNTGLVVIAVIMWGLSSSTRATARGSLFLGAVIVLLAALRRHVWLGLVVVGVMALALNETHLESFDVWAAIFLVCTAVGAAMSLRKWRALRWVAASLPFWALSNAAEWPNLVAVALSIGGLAIAGIAPTLPGRRIRHDGPPLPHLAAGPLAPVAPRVYPASQPSRVLRVITIIFAGLTVVLAALSAGASDPATFGALALSSAILAATFAFCNWFSGRVRLRIDERGLHSRTMFLEHSVRWNEIATLALRYVFLPGMGIRLVYYCVKSPTREFAFPSSMPGAMELKASIEQATGLQWSEPTIEANF